MKAERNMSVELYRALMVFGVCLIHTIGFGPCKDVVGLRYLKSALAMCVCGFVFISGYYGIRFSVIKLLKLWGVGLYAAIVSVLLYWQSGDGSFGSPLQYFPYTIKDNWFLNSYSVLMLLAPVLNYAIRRSRELEMRNALVLAIVGTVGLTFIAQLPLMRSYFPTSAGLDNYSGFTLSGIYMIAGVWREYELERYVKACWWLVLVSISSVYVLSFGCYSSPFSIGSAALLFVWMCHLKVPSAITNVCRLIGPSLLSIFVIHANLYGFRVINNMELRMLECGMPALITVCVAAIGVFVGGGLIDMLRRVLLLGSRRSFVSMHNTIKRVVQRGRRRD